MTTDATRDHCIDAELMAAWADAGLSADEAARVELHLSNCGRCQEVLAAFMRSQPQAAVVIPFWTRRPVQWSAAGLAAAAALVLMVWTPWSPTVPMPETTMASRDAAPGAPAVPPPTVPPPTAPATPTLPPVTKSAKAASAPADATTEAVTVAAAAPPPAPVATRPSPVAAPPPPPPAATMPPPPPAQSVTLGGRAAATTASAGAIEPMFERVAPESLPIEIIAPDPAAAAALNQGLAARGGGIAGGRAGGRGGAGGTPAPARWRILAGTRVERSTDAGTTWSAADLPASRPLALTAGAATSQSVCWLVGKNGAVLVSTNGVLFTLVSAPDPADLQSVRAHDSMNAAVTTVDGRTFTTSDAGKTWKQQEVAPRSDEGLQGF